MAARHVLLVTAGLLSVFLFAGIVFGWQPLIDILLREGFYAERCTDGKRVPCVEQREALNRAFTLASTAVSLVAVPGGFFVDAYGPLAGTIVAGSLNMLGLAGIATCRAIGVEYFDVFLLSFMVLAVGGSLTMLCGYSLPLMFPRRFALLIGLTNCLFDAGCAAVVKGLYDARVDFRSLFWSYFCLCLVNYVSLLASWASNRSELQGSLARPRLWPQPNQEVLKEPARSARSRCSQVCALELLAIFVFAAVQVARSNLYLGTMEKMSVQISATLGAPRGAASRAAAALSLIVPQVWLAVPAIEAWINRLGVLAGTLQAATIVREVADLAHLSAQLTGCAGGGGGPFDAKDVDC